MFYTMFFGFGPIFSSFYVKKLFKSFFCHKLGILYFHLFELDCLSSSCIILRDRMHHSMAPYVIILQNLH